MMFLWAEPEDFATIIAEMAMACGACNAGGRMLHGVCSACLKRASLWHRKRIWSKSRKGSSTAYERKSIHRIFELRLSSAEIDEWLAAMLEKHSARKWMK